MNLEQQEEFERSWGILARILKLGPEVYAKRLEATFTWRHRLARRLNKMIRRMLGV